MPASPCLHIPSAYAFSFISVLYVRVCSPSIQWTDGQDGTGFARICAQLATVAEPSKYHTYVACPSTDCAISLKVKYVEHHWRRVKLQFVISYTRRTRK